MVIRGDRMLNIKIKIKMGMKEKEMKWEIESCRDAVEKLAVEDPNPLLGSNCYIIRQQLCYQQLRY